MNSRKQGDLGSSFAIAYFSSIGYTVALPLADSQPYDLIIEKDGICQRIQVKTTFKKNKNNKYSLETRTISNTRGKKLEIRKLSPSDFDLLFAMDGDGKFYVIPSSDLENVSQLSLSSRQRYCVILKTIFGSDVNS